MPPQTPEWTTLWKLDPSVVFLNHGSFGACPKVILDKQTQWRSQLESQPLRFFMREFEELLDRSRDSLAAFVGAVPEELVFVPNATTGVNAVLRSLTFSPDDELLTTNHEYNASRNALDFVAHRSGARVVVAHIPLPIESPQQIIEAVMAQVSTRTRLVLLDHVTSQTGVIFPIAELVSKLREYGIDTLIDGAHAPGMLPLNLQEIGSAYYTGNCHKWLCAPKGAAFLYVRRDKQSEIRPLTISHGANSPRTERTRFQLEFDWMGTTDPSAYFCVPAAIEFMGSLLPGGWQELMERNHRSALAARQLLCNALGVQPLASEEMIGAMAVIPMPPVLDNRSVLSLHDELLDKFGIEVQIVPWSEKPRLLLRISAQIYNTQEQYEYLGSAIASLYSSSSQI